MVNQNTLDRLTELGFEADADGLEMYIAKLQDAAGMGDPLVPDSLYDEYTRLLRQLKPNSEVLNRNWETDDYELDENLDSLLETYGMCSINTIQKMDELYKFKDTLDEIGEPVELVFSIKENGHGVRAVYKFGELVSSTTRGRYKKGRDITKHAKIMLPNYVEQFAEIPLVEIRGEVLVKISVFEQYLANVCKTPLSSVTSLIRESATDEEIALLDMVCYKVLASEPEKLNINSLEEEYSLLNECGFKTPQCAKLGNITSANLDIVVDKVISYFESKMDNGEIEYSCDGIVATLNSNELFYGSGRSGNAWNGNIALKMGKYWESNVYSAKIISIEFVPGKSYIVPKAIIEPTIASNGATVTTVPLYNIGVMERYKYIPGNEIYFRFGGEVGVLTCDRYGNSVKQ